MKAIVLITVSTVIVLRPVAELIGPGVLIVRTARTMMDNTTLAVAVIEACVMIVVPVSTFGVVAVAAEAVMVWTEIWYAVTLCIDVSIHVQDTLGFLNVIMLSDPQVVRLHEVLEVTATDKALLLQELVV